MDAYLSDFQDRLDERTRFEVQGPLVSPLPRWRRRLSSEGVR